MNFSDFVKSESNNKNESNRVEEKKFNASDVEEQAKQYASLSKDELEKKLFDETQKLKASGEFDFEKIRESLQGARSYLNESQQNMLDSLLGKIK